MRNVARRPLALFLAVRCNQVNFLALDKKAAAALPRGRDPLEASRVSTRG